MEYSESKIMKITELVLAPLVYQTDVGTNTNVHFPINVNLCMGSLEPNLIPEVSKVPFDIANLLTRFFII